MNNRKCTTIGKVFTIAAALTLGLAITPTASAQYKGCSNASLWGQLLADGQWRPLPVQRRNWVKWRPCPYQLGRSANGFVPKGQVRSFSTGSIQRNHDRTESHSGKALGILNEFLTLI
jgi:hypothetical protein